MNCLDTAWRQHAAELRGWLRRRLNQPQDVEDMMQDLFMKALRQGSGFCKIQNPRAWLFEVARNALADRLKSEREALALPDDLAAPAPEDAPVDGLTACLPRVLSELNDADRQAIVLCDLGGMPQADYAAQVGLTLSAAKSRLQRARLRLRDRMATACQVTMGTGGQVEDFVPGHRLSPLHKAKAAPLSGPIRACRRWFRTVIA